MSDLEQEDFVIEGVDLDGVDAWDGESAPLVPPGDYQLQIIKMESKSGAKGTYIKTTFEIVSDGDQKGNKVWNNYSLTKDAIGRLKQLAVAVGAPLQGFQASNYVGQTIEATVYHSEGTAKTDGDGNVMPARTFANIKNERAVAPVATSTTKAPPVTKGATAPATTKPATNAAPRRA